MQYCELCGDKIGGLSVYSCKIMPNQLNETMLCKNCASCFNARLDNDKITKFINWSDNLINKNILHEPYLSQMVHYNKEAKEKISNEGKKDLQNNLTNDKESEHSQINNISDPVSVFSNKPSSNKWIKIVKFLGYLSIIVSTIIGFAVGSILKNHLTLLCGIIGFSLGVFGCAFTMMIASLCEDVSEIKTRVR